MIEESVVREVVRALQGLRGRSKYDLYALGSRADGTTRLPICGKGTVDKIERLLQKGALQPYIAFLEKGYSGDSKTVSPEESEGSGQHGLPQQDIFPEQVSQEPEADRESGKAASVPTSSRSSDAVDSDLARDTALQSDHIEELLTLAEQMRGFLDVPSPFDATAWHRNLSVRITGWRLPGLPCPSIEGFTLSEEQQALLPELRSHMNDEGWWRDLEALDEEAVRYCYSLWDDINLMVGTAYQEIGFPLLQPHQEGVAGLYDECFDTAIQRADAWSHGDPNPTAWDLYHSGRKSGELTELTFGSVTLSVIALAPEDDHEQIIQTHRLLTLRLSGPKGMPRSLLDSHSSLETALADLRLRLIPGRMRRIVTTGHCEVCPLTVNAKESSEAG